MPPLQELQRDKSFRIKLILVCLVVALSVSAIYVTVSYRLANDIGAQADLESLHRQALLIHGQLALKGQTDSSDFVAKLIHQVYFTDENPELYIEIHGPDLNWSINNNINSDVIDHLLYTINQADSDTIGDLSLSNGHIDIDEHHFLWQKVVDNTYQVLVLKNSNYIQQTLSFVTKRLGITSLIVFWLATWFALTLSSWMNKRVQDKNDSLAHLATHDTLTGLPNRLYLRNLLQDIMPEAMSPSLPNATKTHTSDVTQACLFVIDLDKFKEVNDAFGHTTGDSLLAKIAQKLKDTLDRTQTLIRFSGDKFIIWAPEIDIEHAELLVKKLIDRSNEPVLINKLAISTGASIGIAHYPSQATDSETLIMYADAAMSEAKQNRSGWATFSEKNIECGKQHLKRRAELEVALSEAQIKLHYQPKVSVADGQIIGVEGLARWYHPTDGILSPINFIDLIEHSGRVQEFGRYIITQAISQLGQWHQQGWFTPIAINLSPYNLLDPTLLEFTLSLLKQHDIPPNKLEIELIESETTLSIDLISKQLNAFKEAGVQVAIDDFGTGMSSLSYISTLNVNHIKIDRSFIDGIEQDTRKQAIVSSVIMLAHSFECEVIAEGIENKLQADMLIKMGCLYGQGYYYAKPMTAENIQAILKTNTILPL
ncbi:MULTISPECIES: putative bifunctional diguanylate cyclase/phosphodiesterase [Marinomonas]|uniref:EAL domain-containing protein n=1 Tax=Marinomonas rhodophyticola TaxID=2992803 RepID=A0ABT3KKI4_9GAMM|nr:EAL domain-containing protein [Marinomonas sp. KJ51-3]MCW4631071.1 EAL domain-containing protein [Marinomonas sp. KJ51-3]